MMTRIHEAKTLIKIFYAILNENSIVQHLIQIKNGITTNISGSVKCTVRVKKIMVGILAHVSVR